MKNTKPTILQLKVFIFGMLCLTFLTGCISASYSPSTKTPNYHEKIKSVIIWNTGGLSEKYSTLVDRMDNTALQLKKGFDGRGIAAQTLSTNDIELNKNSKLQDLANKMEATHYITLRVLRTSKRNASIAVEFYTYDVTLIDMKTKKEVWRTVVDANFYSSSDAMASQIFDSMAKDDLF